MLVERLREVSALIGFTRLDGPDAETHNIAPGAGVLPNNAQRNPSITPAMGLRP